MTITLTALGSADTTITAQQTMTVTATPLAGPAIYCAAFSRNGASTPTTQATPLTDTQSNTWTLIALSSGGHTFGSSYFQFVGAWVCTTPAQTSTTFTFDPWSTTDTMWGTGRLFSAVGTGAVSVSTTPTPTTQANSTTTASVTLTVAAPAASQTTIAVPSANVDLPFAAMAAVSGWTATMNAVPNAYATCAVFSQAGFTGTSFVESNVGTGVSMTGGLMFALEEAGGAPAARMFLTPTRSTVTLA